ncbi:retrotransposon protein, putative, ty1-copia subclass [Tanacetum coccineum]
MGYYFYYPLENKIFVARYVEFFETRLIKQEASGSTIDFDEIQSEDAQPSENTSLHQHEVKPDTVEPQTDEHELGDHGEPPNYRAALSDPESEKWLEAMNAEMQSMKDNQVWNLVDLPPNSKGFTQTYEVDYDETFSPTADIKAIRILIAITAYYDYEIWQMDVKTAFLNGRLKEDVYMARKCFAMKDLGEAAYILGIKIYQDRSRRLIGLSQNAYINKTLKRFRMDTSKCGTIPMQPNVDLSNTQGPSTLAEVKRMKGIPYASAVGSIMYAVRCTRPDVAFSQNLTSRYQQNLGESYWTAVNNILKYLRNTKDMFLVYGGDSTTELGVTCYTDASWETDRDDL